MHMASLIERPIGAAPGDADRLDATRSPGAKRCVGLEAAMQATALASIPQQLVQRDRQIAHTLASGMIDRIRDRRRGTDDADFADAFDTERIDLVIPFFDKDHID